MKVEVIPLNGLMTRVLVVDDDDETFPCENCGKDAYNHELLAKEDQDWCMTCNDEHYRKDMTDEQMAFWSIEQMIEGKVIVIVRRDE